MSLFYVNQSEMSIVLSQSIRDKYCFVSTNQKRVLTWVVVELAGDQEVLLLKVLHMFPSQVQTVLLP